MSVKKYGDMVRDIYIYIYLKILYFFFTSNFFVEV